MNELAELQSGPLAQAFKLYLSELESHLLQLNTTFEPLRTFDDRLFFEACAKEAKQLEHAFHTLRGGAGFLGLKSVAETAKEGESLFKHGAVNSPLSELRPAVTRIIGALEEHLSLLRAESAA